MDFSVFPDRFERDGYVYARLDEAGLDTVKSWLLSRHLHDWWTPDLDEMQVIAREVKASQKARHVARYIASYQGREFAYLQCGEPRADMLPEAFEPEDGTTLFQQFVGDADMIGFGHGTNVVKAFTEEVAGYEDVTQMIVSPLADNQPAIRSYMQAGYRPKMRGTTRDGVVQLMARFYS